jgi:cytochrome P450
MDRLPHCAASREHPGTSRLHRNYGEAVRFGPGEVSFITAQAWKDIYGHGHRQLPKFDFTSDMKTPDIINSNDADHSRYRKALSHGFSAKGLQEQEPLLRGYIDQLIKRLREDAHADVPTDMVKLYNLTTFDMIGDLAFGKSFGGLLNDRLHYWISTTRSVSYRRALGTSKSTPNQNTSF